jgi:hypothetical protein
MKPKLTKAQMRVIIAKDAIKQIRAQVLQVQTGNYLILPESTFEIDQQTCLEQPCKVCQLGSALVSAIHKFNHETAFTIHGSDSRSLVKKLKRWFSIKQMVMMEAAFEKSTAACQVKNQTNFNISRKLLDACFDFAGQNLSGVDLSIAIWKNVIKNKGEFKP